MPIIRRATMDPHGKLATSQATCPEYCEQCGVGLGNCKRVELVSISSRQMQKAAARVRSFEKEKCK
jgi:hypothetical protein